MANHKHTRSKCDSSPTRIQDESESDGVSTRDDEGGHSIWQREGCGIHWGGMSRGVAADFGVGGRKGGSAYVQGMI
jgi:hypothetical protein